MPQKFPDPPLLVFWVPCVAMPPVPRHDVPNLPFPVPSDKDCLRCSSPNEGRRKRRQLKIDVGLGSIPDKAAGLLLELA